MNVFVANEQDLPLDELRAAALARHVLSSEDVEEDSELSVLFITRDHMRRLNRRFAGNDYATDVLAFPMGEDDEDDEEEEESLLGDVVVCPHVAQTNAATAGHSLTRELDMLVVHGILHLLGYDHQAPDDKQRMDLRLQELLDTFEPAHLP